MSDKKPDATWHPGTGPTPRGAADVLREHPLMPWDGRGAWTCACSRIGVPDGAVVFADRDSAAQHQADMLAAAGLLATADPVVIEVHHHDIEKHAEHFNEGYETAVAQGLADDPTLAADWLAEHDAQVAASAWDEGFSAGRPVEFFGMERPMRQDNPYRTDRIAGGAA